MSRGPAWVLPRALLVSLGWSGACERATTGASVDPAGVAEGTAPVEAPAQSEPSAPPESASLEPAYDWRQDPRVQALMLGSHRSYASGDQLAAAAEQTEERVVQGGGLEVFVVRGFWAMPFDEGTDAREFSGRAYLVVITPVVTHVVQIARQHQDGFVDDLAERMRVPAVPGGVQWHGVGVPGPDLVLEVESESYWGTQCDYGYDARTEGVACDLQGGAMLCARVPLELDFYNGCGGREAIDFDERHDQEDRCARVSFAASWSPEPSSLKVTLDDADDMDCLDVDPPRAWDDRWPPAPQSSWAELFEGPYGLTVTTVPHTDDADPPAPGG